MNNYFCVLPFFSYEIIQTNSKNIYCCRLEPGTDINQVQQSILNQQRAPECSTCWKLEDHGNLSERQIHNSTFDYYTDRDIELIEQDARAGQYQTKIVKLHTSNLCNGTCVTCDHNASSAWAALENRTIDYQKIPESTLDNIDWKEITQLSFVGGEPLLEKKNFQILQHLIDQHNTDCFISIVTNGSIELSAGQLNILSKFSKLNICLSIDGVANSFEYMRWPLQWDILAKNLNTFKQQAQHVSVSCMISNLNIMYFDRIIDFFIKQDINYLCKQIEYPSYFAPGNLPEDYKQLVLERNIKNQDLIQGFLQCGQYSSELFQHCWKEIDRQDSLKKISIDDYLPEFSLTRI
jgi:MoaA/NifB/PqqE/SkfB family radical SAM enzyme